MKKIKWKSQKSKCSRCYAIKRFEETNSHKNGKKAGKKE